jgi:ribonuclease III
MKILKMKKKTTTDHNLSLLEKKLGLKFKNQDLLKQSLVHRSYLNEHPGFHLNHNERLEFLGDAVLELITTKFLYQNFDNPEGELTSFRASLVNTKNLSKIAQKINLSPYVYLSKGEKKSKGKAKEAILANAFEALIGAIYLDQGFKIAENFIQKNLLPQLEKIIKEKSYQDPKSKFQEITQEKFKITPVYRLIKDSGPDHSKIFTVGVFLNNELIAQDKGRSKHEAELKTARRALLKIKKL